MWYLPPIKGTRTAIEMIRGLKNDRSSCSKKCQRVRCPPTFLFCLTFFHGENTIWRYLGGNDMNLTIFVETNGLRPTRCFWIHHFDTAIFRWIYSRVSFFENSLHYLNKYIIIYVFFELNIEVISPQNIRQHSKQRYVFSCKNSRKATWNSINLNSKTAI